jgi:predicted NUDIX family NTP pyrophosphohydrolase
MRVHSASPRGVKAVRWGHDMARQRSAGIVLVRAGAAGPEVLLVHPGGPFWARKDAGAWSIPKGVLEPGEDELAAARREFTEETGAPCPEGPFSDLGEIAMKSGKVVRAFSARGDFDVATLKSNEIEVEWPAKSGKLHRIPEVDRACWASLERARVLLNPAQIPLVERALGPPGP